MTRLAAAGTVLSVAAMVGVLLPWTDLAGFDEMAEALQQGASEVLRSLGAPPDEVARAAAGPNRSGTAEGFNGWIVLVLAGFSAIACGLVAARGPRGVPGGSRALLATAAAATGVAAGLTLADLGQEWGPFRPQAGIYVTLAATVIGTFVAGAGALSVPGRRAARGRAAH